MNKLSIRTISKNVETVANSDTRAVVETIPILRGIDMGKLFIFHMKNDGSIDERLLHPRGVYLQTGWGIFGELHPGKQVPGYHEDGGRRL